MDPAVDHLVSMSDCDSAIARYEARLIKVKRHRNSLLPISRLHRELLHYIFQLALSDEDDESIDAIPSHAYYTALFVLRRVSRRWEDEIVNTPLFWRLISPLLSASLQDLIWERSRDTALSVDVSRRWDDYEGFGGPTWDEPEKAYLERVMARGIEEFRARVPADENLDWYLVDHDHPRMRVLLLHGEWQTVCTRPLRFPRLAVLTVCSCLITWDGLQNLRVLSVSSASGPSLAQLVQVLQSSPLLEELYLCYIEVLPDGAVVPLNPINLPQLSTLFINHIPADMASGLLERLSLSSMCRASEIKIPWSEELGLSGFFYQAGRICTPQTPGEQAIYPQLFTGSEQLQLEIAPRRYLRTSLDWHLWGNQAKLQHVADVARMFFETLGRLSFKAQSPQFRLEADSMTFLAGGLLIVQELFPETVDLEVASEAGFEGLQVLAEPVTKEGNPVWLLPKLAVLRLSTYDATPNYDHIVPMVIKRTEAAASSPSALSPITLLTINIANGVFPSEFLGRLDEAGIKHKRDGITLSIPIPR